MNYMAGRGKGDPNEDKGENMAAMQVLYSSLPDFVTKTDFEWAVAEAMAKKKPDFSKAEFFTYEEGLSVQCMHFGPYDDCTKNPNDNGKTDN